MVAKWADHLRSRYGVNAEGGTALLLTGHGEYLAPGANQTTRAAADRALFTETLWDELVSEIRGYLQQQKALGTDHVRTWVEARTGRFAAARPVGQPLRRSRCP
jgi:putative transposase